MYLRVYPLVAKHNHFDNIPDNVVEMMWVIRESFIFKLEICFFNKLQTIIVDNDCNNN